MTEAERNRSGVLKKMAVFLKAKQPSEDEVSPEVQAILDAVSEYIDKHDSDCTVVLGVTAYDADSEMTDERILFHGERHLVRTHLECLSEELVNYELDGE